MLVRGWAREPHNAFAEAVQGYSVWSVQEQLTASLIDAVMFGNWLLGRVNGVKSMRRPKPVPRPWDTKPTTYGRGALPLDQIDGWISSTIDDEGL